MKKLLIWVMFLLSLSLNCQAANITAKVNRSPVPLGEVFTLTLTADESVNATPDLSVLENNFKVYSTSVSRQNYIINGQSSASTSWQIGLMALNLGEQEIPSISIGKDKSSPLKITVADASSITTDNQNTNGEQAKVSPYYLSAKLVNQDTKYYVQQQIDYEVTLTDSGSLRGNEPAFDINGADDWIIRGLGNPTVINEVDKNGNPIRKITFKYALFPQKSGELTIPAVWFNGYTLNNDMSAEDIFNQDIFNISVRMPSLFGMDKPVSLRAPEQKINILPVPGGYKGSWWLPAQSVRLESKWDKDISNIKAGEAISRTVTLEAVGVTENQLPEINFPSAVGLKQYPEKPELKGGLYNQNPAAQEKIVNVYIPEKSGKITIPAIKVDWYNTKTQTFEQALLPAEEIEVLPGLGYTATEPQVTEPVKAEPEPEAKPENLAPMTDNDNKASTKSQYEYFGLGLAFICGLLLGYLLLRYQNKNRAKPECEMRQYPSFLIKKAYQNDFRALRDGLISWATGFYDNKPINNLKDIVKAADDEEFGRQMDIILTKLYNPKDEVLWNPKVFADSLERVIKNKSKKTDKEVLPQLYE